MPVTAPDKFLLDLSASTVLVDATKRAGGIGFLFTVNVTTAGSSAGGVYDNNSTSGNTAANQIAVVPNTVGTYHFYGFPFRTGLVYVPGTSQVASVSFY